MSAAGSPTDGLHPAASEDAARLQAEIEAAKRRLDAVTRRLAAREAEAKAAMSGHVRAARAELAEMEIEHRESIASIDSAAKAEAAHLLARARAEVDAARAAAGSVNDVR